jgi:hypothetical protein
LSQALADAEPDLYRSLGVNLRRLASAAAVLPDD